MSGPATPSTGCVRRGVVQLLDGADGPRAPGRGRTLAEHTFVHRSKDLEALWTA